MRLFHIQQYYYFTIYSHILPKWKHVNVASIKITQHLSKWITHNTVSIGAIWSYLNESFSSNYSNYPSALNQDSVYRHDYAMCMLRFSQECDNWLQVHVWRYESLIWARICICVWSELVCVSFAWFIESYMNLIEVLCKG